MTKIDQKMSKIRQIDPKISKKNTLISQFHFLKILPGVPVPTIIFIVFSLLYIWAVDELYLVQLLFLSPDASLFFLLFLIVIAFFLSLCLLLFFPIVFVFIWPVDELCLVQSLLLSAAAN